LSLVFGVEQCQRPRRPPAPVRQIAIVQDLELDTSRDSILGLVN
jgi:hypothetical protein